MTAKSKLSYKLNKAKNSIKFQIISSIISTTRFFFNIYVIQILFFNFIFLN